MPSVYFPRARRSSRRVKRCRLSECENRILADANVSCPPAVPLAVCGERLTPEVISAMEYYGTEHCTVVVE